MASDSIRAAMSTEQINIILFATAIIAVATAILQTSKSIHYKLQWMKCHTNWANTNNELLEAHKEKNKVLADRKVICESYLKKDRECELLRSEKSAISESCRVLQDMLAERAKVDNVVRNTHEMIKSIDEPVQVIGGHPAPKKECYYCSCGLFDYEPGTIGGGDEGKRNVDCLGNNLCRNSIYGGHVPVCTTCKSGKPCWIDKQGNVTSFCADCIPF